MQSEMGYMCDGCRKRFTIILRCGKCSSPYCSRECQVKDWQRHKLVCSDSTIINQTDSTLLAERTLKYLGSLNRDISLPTDKSKIRVLEFILDRVTDVLSLLCISDTTVEEFSEKSGSSPDTYKRKDHVWIIIYSERHFKKSKAHIILVFGIPL